MRKIHLLWTDDEIDLLRPYIIFLKEKGYEITTASSGFDTIELVRQQSFDLILLDENMPGISGLQTLAEIKQLRPEIPVVMVTKSEEENIMEEAIGSQIADYLIKPVNPNQILLTIKKNIDHKRLVSEKTTSAYQSEFNKLSAEISMASTINDWETIYRKLVYWELELEKSQDTTMDEILRMQKTEANAAYSKHIKNNYLKWFTNDENSPLISPNIFRKKVYPLFSQKKKVVVILIDNLRLDQWKTLQQRLNNWYTTNSDDLFFSILPTATQYSRNSMFAGLMPSEIDKLYSDIWLNDDEEGGKNMHEEELLKKQHARLGRNESLYYAKILTNRDGHKLNDNFANILQNDLVVLVYNFVDMLSHARTEMNMIRELAADEPAYRSLTESWFLHSPLLELLQRLAEQKDLAVVITTDHGSIQVADPIKVIGDKNTTANLRYKQGRNLNYNPKEVFEITDPAKAYLPKSNVSSTYIFSMNNDFFAYPNNYNHYVKYYKNTFQHGGISMEEMMIPIACLFPK